MTALKIKAINRIINTDALAADKVTTFQSYDVSTEYILPAAYLFRKYQHIRLEFVLAKASILRIHVSQSFKSLINFT